MSIWWSGGRPPTFEGRLELCEPFEGESHWTAKPFALGVVHGRSQAAFEVGSRRDRGELARGRPCVVLVWGSAPQTDVSASATWEEMGKPGDVAIVAVCFQNTAAKSDVETAAKWCTLLRWLQEFEPHGGLSLHANLRQQAELDPQISRLMGLESHERALRELAAVRLVGLFCERRVSLALTTKRAIEAYESEWSDVASVAARELEELRRR